MNHVIKKVIGVLLACLILSSMFVACRKTGDTGSTAAEKGEEAPTQATPAQKEKVTFTWVWKDREAAAEGDEEVRQYINEKFNVDFKTVFIPGSELLAKLGVMIAAGDTIDCSYAFFNSPGSVCDVAGLRSSKQIQPLNDYLNKYGQNILKGISEDMWAFTKDESGNIWFIPDLGFDSKFILFVRKDWMEKFNVSEPKTIDEFEQMLITFRYGDPDGNGKPDTYPMAGETYYNLIYCFAGSFLPQSYNWFEKDGQLLPPFMHENYKEFLTTLSRWYKEKLIHPDQLVLKNPQVKDLATKGICGVFPNWYSLSYQDEIREAIPGADMTYIHFPIGPSGTGGAIAQPLFGGGFVIYSRVKPEVAERIIEIVDWFNTPEGTNFQWYGIEGKHWVKNGDKIEPAPGIDPQKPKYKAQLYINAGNAWKYFTESSLVKPELMSVTRQLAIAGKYPALSGPDYMFPYQWKNTKTEVVMSDLGSMESDMFIKIFTGEKPVDWLDEWIQEWMKAGGDTYIKEKTEQYLKLKPMYGKK